MIKKSLSKWLLSKWKRMIKKKEHILKMKKSRAFWSDYWERMKSMRLMNPFKSKTKISYCGPTAFTLLLNAHPKHRYVKNRNFQFYSLQYYTSEPSIYGIIVPRYIICIHFPITIGFPRVDFNTHRHTYKHAQGFVISTPWISHYITYT